MAKIFLFMMVSVDGYFEGENHDISWHNVDVEFNEFAIKQTREAGTLLFGRKTYELMADYWPTEKARQDDPTVAKIMNTTPKLVFSHRAEGIQETEHWKNVTLKNHIDASDIERLKQTSPKDIAILGSNNLCVQLMEKDLVDEFRLMVNPVALGKGTPLFYGLKGKRKFKLTNSRTFNSGNTLLTYQPNN